MLSSVEWGEYRIGDLFEVKGTLSFNKEALVSGDEYDYVTRTSQNQGILQTTAFVNRDCCTYYLSDLLYISLIISIFVSCLKAF